ncbi:MAG TPA: flavodoxin domain-containing protein [Spirochaetia bacterium]|nr:flavodoxin domain-containing protein [Spirochaetia bacterium]
MKILIAYRSKYGFTEECVRSLKRGIEGETILVDLKAERNPETAPFDIVLLGGSIYGGMIQREVTAFCSRNRESLLAKPVGLFLSCLYRGEKAREQFESSFPGWLLAHAFGRYHMGGEIVLEKLGLIDRFLIRRFAGQREDKTENRGQVVADICRAVNQRAGAS